ncbi:hypothetical protein QJS10_CPB12g01506 [Acorus calamus]|uniref:Uncharacterized protein n=1 Tax=Acorus calamus TaxID=4465 RepID=A0AAV9DMR8_ACOCL|nr:hypothetical protein QJS10_CPB12g01506 [Acorus calamus]
MNSTDNGDIRTRDRWSGATKVRSREATKVWNIGATATEHRRIFVLVIERVDS